ncbi:helix-turn-helix domain-containing protein [Radiobacillus sp. PE A8.2]|uniref:helix-turn-helix domain-containing protein n=1 Tax=Radiobacillus sp. PE A8.2 TaxID=3380349 RepID=UPI00388F3520
MILSNADYSNYKKLSKFENTEHLNNSIRGFLYKYKHELNQSVIDVYRTIANFAVKLSGVAFLKQQTIAEIIGKSIATIKRSLKVLKDLKAIEIHRTKREKGRIKGGFGHNVFVICDLSDELSGELSKMNHREEAETPCHQTQKQQNYAKESSHSESNHLKEFKKRKTNLNYDKEFLSSNLPRQFVDTVSSFHDNQTVFNLWNRLCLATKKHADSSLILSHIDMFIKTYKECIWKFKTNRIQGDFIGYVYGAWVNTCKNIILEQNSRIGLYYDWLA